MPLTGCVKTGVVGEGRGDVDMMAVSASLDGEFIVSRLLSVCEWDLGGCVLVLVISRYLCTYHNLGRHLALNCRFLLSTLRSIGGTWQIFYLLSFHDTYPNAFNIGIETSTCRLQDDACLALTLIAHPGCLVPRLSACDACQCIPDQEKPRIWHVAPRID